jgi:GTP cyclohydrolase IA
MLHALIADEIGESHVSSSVDTPLRADAFELSDDEKIKVLSHHFYRIMQTLGLDMTDDSLSGTPQRIAKMYVQEIFRGLNPENKPAISLFENKYEYKDMVLEKDITLYSYCEHHFVPIIGKAHVAYCAKGHVIGLSKINRLVQYYASRPQVQERLTLQIADGLKEAIQTEDVAVLIEASHLCVAARGIKDTASTTITNHFSGRFLQEKTQQLFLSMIK